MKLTSSRTALAVATVFLLGVATTACGDDDDEAGDSTAPPAGAATSGPAATDATETTGATDTTEATDTTGATDTTEASDTTGATGATGATTGGSAAAGASEVMTAEGELGTFLVDGEGMTLYLFLPDAQGPSVCMDQCLAAWPALAGPATAGAGADQTLLATATRTDDNSEQATYNGWPLYYFAQDAAPGDVNGQGLNDVWFVVDPAGNAIGAP